MNVFHFKFTEVEKVWKKVALWESQVLIAKIIEVGMDKCVDWANSIFRLVDK